MKHGIWSEDEHDRFLLAVKEFPRGPWSSIANVIGTRSVRQVQTHTQKYYEKIVRRVRGLRKGRKAWARVEHRIDDDILEFCEFMKSMGSLKVITSPILKVSSPPRLTIDTKAAHGHQTVTSAPIASPCSPFQACATFAGVTPDTNAADSELLTMSPLTSDPIELPPLEEALDFLITVMEQ